jgi:hypothetical protein
MPIYFQLIFALMIWHALADYPLQGPYLSVAKNRNNPEPGVWFIAMFMHGLIHAGGVWLITGFVSLAVAELVVHCIIDDFKCRNKISFGTDQFLHVNCKIVYACLTLIWTDWKFTLGHFH